MVWLQYAYFNGMITKMRDDRFVFHLGCHAQYDAEQWVSDAFGFFDHS